MLNKIIEEVKESFVAQFPRSVYDCVGNDFMEAVSSAFAYHATKGIQKALESVRLKEIEITDNDNGYMTGLKPSGERIGGNKILGYNSACEELDTKINKLLL